MQAGNYAHAAVHGQQGANQTYSYEGAVPAPEPECEPLPVLNRVRKDIEVFVNERYSPRLGFSAKGLLVNDRGAFSNNDGTISWATLEEAGQCLLALGWRYEGDWMMTSAYNTSLIPLTTAGNDEGWMFSSDFGSFASHPGHAKKGISHFVRRRKLQRMQVFDERMVCANEIQTCQTCDLRRLDQLVPLLLESLWKAMHARYGGKEMRLDKIVKLKNLLINSLFAVPQNAFSHHHIAQQLEGFVMSQANGSSSKVSSIPAFSLQGEGAKLLEALSREERMGIARAVIRKFDTSYAYHCAVPQCGTACAFAVQRCPNHGCDVRFSRKWWGEHDANCPHKVIACPLQCGRIVVRHQAEMHMQQECIMRPVPCPYHRVNCQPAGLIFRDVQEHCSLNHAYHLSLTTAAIDVATTELGALRQQEASKVATVNQLLNARAGRR